MLVYGLKWSEAHALVHPLLDACADCVIAKRELRARDEIERSSQERIAAEGAQELRASLPENTPAGPIKRPRM